MAEAVEPLQALISRIVRRPRQKPQYTPVEFEEVDGAMRGIPGGIAQADDAQSFDISSAAPPTQPIFARGEEDEGPDSPFRLASGGGGESSPFQLASSPGQAPMQQATQGYRKVCQGGVCRMVPIESSAAMPAPQLLPQGVVLGPGESFVPGSLREGPARQAAQPAAQAAPAAAQPAAAQPALAPSGPSPIPDRPRSGTEILEDLANKIQGWGEQSMSDAEQQYSRADQAKDMRDAIGFVQYDERGDLSRQAGHNARALYTQARQAQVSQGNLEAALELKRKDMRSRSIEGQMEEEAQIMGMVGRSIPVRARRLFEIRNAVAVAQSAPMDEKRASDTMDMILGEIHATDASDYYMQYRDAVGRFNASKSPRDVMAARAARAQAYSTMMDRFGDAKDLKTLESRMRKELTPIFRARYEERYKSDPSLLPKGAGKESAILFAQEEAIKAVNSSIGSVWGYIQRGENPHDEAARMNAKSPQEEE